MPQRIPVPTIFAIALAICCCPATLATAQESPKVKVFLLTGQSNMVGQAKLSLLEYQLTQPGTREQLAHLRGDDGGWKERGDVWIKFLDRKGKLKAGYGGPNRIGPELQFGITMGNHFEEPVVLIKTAWGGKSLWRDFRPPSSGLPSDAALQQLLENQRKKNPDLALAQVKADFGHFYREMLKETKAALSDLGAHFPELKGRDHELAGVVWFQGWNDMINAQYTAEYAGNMANFIRDVRKDLDAPELPFVIGVMGVDGNTPNAKQQAFRDAQTAPAALEEFKDNVAVVQTGDYWDTEAHAVFKKGWKENVEEWNKVGSDRPYHYLGSVKTMIGIGRGFAEALLQLSGETVKK